VIADQVDLDQLVYNMNEILNKKERYDIISQWLENGPVNYYNLVRQTEMAIFEKQKKNSILLKIKNMLFNKGR